MYFLTGRCCCIFLALSGCSLEDMEQSHLQRVRDPRPSPQGVPAQCAEQLSGPADLDFPSWERRERGKQNQSWVTSWTLWRAGHEHLEASTGSPGVCRGAEAPLGAEEVVYNRATEPPQDLGLAISHTGTCCEIGKSPAFLLGSCIFLPGWFFLTSTSAFRSKGDEWTVTNSSHRGQGVSWPSLQPDEQFVHFVSYQKCSDAWMVRTSSLFRTLLFFLIPHTQVGNNIHSNHFNSNVNRGKIALLLLFDILPLYIQGRC